MRATAILVRLLALRDSAASMRPRPHRDPPDEGTIAAPQAAIGAVVGELFCKSSMCTVRLCHDQQAGGVLVQPVHDAGSLYPTNPGEACSAMRNQRVDERAGGVSGSWVHGKALGLVDDDEIRILVEDDERNVLTSNVGSLARRQAQLIDLADLDLAAQV